MGSADPAERLTVHVACSVAAGIADEVTIEMSAGATVLDALRASGVLERHPSIDLAAQPVGVWGRLRTLDAVLCAGDRVEVYRPLQIDPKEARRRRGREQAATCSRRR